MDKIKVLLVDDEFLALRLLENFIKKIPDLEIVGKEKSPINAIDILNKHQIDLLFLDVQMPLLSGINLLKTINKQPTTIFTTAYSENAIDAFELDAVDYLLKPFSFERFMKAVNKAKEHIRHKQAHKLPEYVPKKPTSSTQERFISIKSDSKITKIPLDEILFIEGMKEYVKIICKSEKFVSLTRLKNIEEKLPSDEFLRIHKSYIVNISQVKSAEGNRLRIAGNMVPISREKKNKILSQIFGKGFIP